MLFTPKGPYGLHQLNQGISSGPISMSGISDHDAVLRVYSATGGFVLFGNSSVDNPNREGSYIRPGEVQYFGVPRDATHFSLIGDDAFARIIYSLGYEGN